MNDTTRTPALSRTWHTVTRDRMDGAVVQIREHTVTLTRASVGGVIEATVNGQPATLEAATRILQGADQTTVLDETLSPATISRPVAANLHRLMGRAGLKRDQHYAFAAAALDRVVWSFTTLTEAEAETVRADLRLMFPGVAA